MYVYYGQCNSSRFSTTYKIASVCFTSDGPKSLEEKRGSPLPPIGYKGTSHSQPAPAGSLQLPDCPIVVAMGQCLL